MKDPKKAKKTEENIHRLFEKIPTLRKVFKILKENGIRYGIFAGTHVFLLTSYRDSTDVDILVADEDFEKLSDFFKGHVKRRKEKNVNGDFFYLNEDRNLEFVSRLDFIESGEIYPIRLTPLAWENNWKFKVDEVEVVLLNPVDTVLEKAILPRGKEVGKHDLEDIKALVNVCDIDKDYLEKRVDEMKAKEHVKNILQKFVFNLTYE